MITFWGGRVVHYAGDGVLAEFECPYMAISSAVQTQRQVSEWNNQRPLDRQLKFRMGMGFGTFLVDNDEIYGATINMAARLQEIARPGHILVSDDLFDRVQDGIDVGFDCLGYISVKGLEQRRIRVYEVLLEPHSIGKLTRRTQSETTENKWALVSVTGLILSIFGILTLWVVPESERLSADTVHRTLLSYSFFEKPSINVVRFGYVGHDPELRYMVEGFTESLAGSLARLPSLHVVVVDKPEVSAQAPRNRQMALEQDAFRFSIAAMVRTIEDGIHVDVSLTDTTTGRKWTGYWSADTVTAVISPENGIIEEISAELQTRILHALYEAFLRKDTDSPESFRLAMRGMEVYWRFTKKDNVEAKRIFTELTSSDPDCTKAWLALAWSYFNEARFGWSDTPDASFSKARGLALRIAAFNQYNGQAEALLEALGRSRSQTD